MIKAKPEHVLVQGRDGKMKQVARATMAGDAKKVDGTKVAAVLRRRYGTPQNFLRSLGISEDYVSRAVRKPAPRQLRPLMALLGLDETPMSGSAQVDKELKRADEATAQVSAGVVEQPLQPGASVRSASDAVDVVQGVLSFLRGKVSSEVLKQVEEMLTSGSATDEIDYLSEPTGSVTNPDNPDQPPPFEGRPNRGNEPLAITGTPMLQASDAASPFGNQTLEEVLRHRGSRSPVGMTLDRAMAAKARAQFPTDSRIPFGRHIGHT